MRGLAIILVVASHAYWRDFVMGGPVGVAVFFALSGYLITGLLLRERDRTGRICLRDFYARRARRLLPALVTFLVVMVALGQLLGPAFATLRDALPTLFYVQNFAHMDPWLPHTLGHTWSLSIEEQFYVAFPLLLIAVGRFVPAGRLALLLGAAAALLLSLRILLWASGASLERFYYGTDTNAGLILIGAAAAAWCHTRGPLKRDLTSWLPLVVVALVVLGFVADRQSARAVVPVLAGLVAVVTLLVCHDRPARGWLTPGWLVLVGRRSYGLYLWHYPLFHVLQPRMPERWWTNVLLVGAAWLLTLISWHFVEEPVLKRAPARTGRARTRRLSVQAVG